MEEQSTNPKPDMPPDKGGGRPDVPPGPPDEVPGPVKPPKPDKHRPVG